MLSEATSHVLSPDNLRAALSILYLSINASNSSINPDAVICLTASSGESLSMAIVLPSVVTR
ncbi:hypothetical protein ECMP0215612_2600 [Escherichia coli MP021561.2]|nr:hypothetical protein ECMP0215612_2600 [Escherichia coli MP021561.2]